MSDSSSDASSIKSDEPLIPTHGDASIVQSTVGTVVQSQGVTRMEAVHRAASTSRSTLYAVGISVVVCAWAYSLDTSTTSNYAALVTSYFSEHSSGLATLSIATNIISAVCKPFIAKISDITSRPYTYTMVLVFYVVGYIIAASARSISAFVVGDVFIAIGGAGLDLINDIIVADLTPLEWRGFVGSMLSAPFIINTWFAGKIVEALSTGEKWRWGYGMFAIIMPVCLGPAICTLIYLDRKAQKEGIVNIASSNAARRAARELAEREGYEAPRGAIVAPAAPPKATWSQSVKKNLEEIDAFGLLLLGLGWSLLLLPFSLKTYAKGGWSNPSLIVMMVSGVLLLFSYLVYEINYARMPSAPRRLLLNKTFVCAVIIDSVYFVSGQLRGLYWGSYVYIGKPWSVQNWTYYNNTMTLALCIFGMVAGLIQRWTHRYKLLQIIGLMIKVVGIGILLKDHRATNDTSTMVLSPILIGMGGSFSVVGSRVGSQASVPHQDLALTISLLALWSKIGSAIGSAIAAVIWSAKMPVLLRENLPSNATETDVKKFFNSIRTIRLEYDFDDPMRQGAIEAYRQTLYFLIVPALVLAFIPLIAACFQTNFYLGKQQNAVTNVAPDGSALPAESIHYEVPSKSKRQAFLRFWAGRG